MIERPAKEHHSDNHLVYSCQYHVIFCPKYRRPVLVNKSAERLKELILKKQEEYGYKILDMEVPPDHVHLQQQVDPKIGAFRAVNKIKGYTSRKLREESPSWGDLVSRITRMARAPELMQKPQPILRRRDFGIQL